MQKPGYAVMEEEGKLQERVDKAYAMLENCQFSTLKRIYLL